MPTDFASSLIFLARLLIGGAFIFAGLRNLTNVPVLTGLMAARGVPQAKAVLFVGIVLQVVAGALLIAGLWTTLAAAGLIGFVVVGSWMFHNFWDHQGLERGTRINGVVSNVALVGAFLLVIANPSWWSKSDAWSRSRKPAWSGFLPYVSPSGTSNQRHFVTFALAAKVASRPEAVRR